MKKLLTVLTVVCLLFASAITLWGCSNDSAKGSNDDGGDRHCYPRPAPTMESIYTNGDGNYTFLQVKLQNIGDMVTVTSKGGDYNYLLVDFKVQKDYSGILQENAVITMPVSLAVLNNEESLAQIVEYYNNKNVPVLPTTMSQTTDEIPPSSAANPPEQVIENVNIDKDKMVSFLNANDSFIVYVHLLSGMTNVEPLSTTDETKKVDALTDVRLFNNKNFYAVKDDVVTQKQIKELCKEVGRFINMELYQNYSKFFYEDITLADFDKNILDFLKK